MVPAGEGTPHPSTERTTMSLLNNTSDFSASPSASARSFALSVLRAVNNFVARVIAQREHQAQLTLLRQLSDRELRDIGLSRTEVGAGLAQAAKDRSRLQRVLQMRA